MRGLLNESSKGGIYPSETRAAGALDTEVLLAAVFDVLIFISYFTIPCQLYWYLKGISQSKAVLRIRLHFILFILSCGLSHLFAALTDAGLVTGAALLILGKGVTALVSMKTAYLLSQYAGELLWLFSRTSKLELYVEELERTNNELDDLREAAEMSAKTSKSILSSVSNELQKPIITIRNNLEVLIPLTKNAEHQRLLQHSRAYAAALQEAITKMLTFSSFSRRQITMKRGPVEVMAIIDQVMDFSKVTVSKEDLQGIRPCIELGPSTPVFVITDPYLLKSALRAVLENALKYTDFGHVVLRVFTRETQVRRPLAERGGLNAPIQGLALEDELTDESSHLLRKDMLGNDRAWSQPAPMELVFQVVDTGIGIPDSEKAKIFEQLVRIDALDATKPPGVGIGLALSDKLMKHLGGTISVSNNDFLGHKRGSVFDLAVPMPVLGPDFGVLPDGFVPSFMHRVSNSVLGVLGESNAIVATDDKIFQKSMESLLIHSGITRISVCNGTDCALSENMNSAVAILGPDVVTDYGWCNIWTDWEASRDKRRCIMVLPAGKNLTGLRNFPLSLEMPVRPYRLAEMLEKACLPAVSGGHDKSPQPNSKRLIRVLIVDGNKANLNVADRMIRRAYQRAEVTTAENGMLAMDCWKASCDSDNPFDLIFIELNMTGLTGRALASKIRKVPGGSSPFLVALTGVFITDTHARSLMLDGFDKVLTKPLAMSTLKEVISDALAFSERGGADGHTINIDRHVSWAPTSHDHVH